MDGRTEGMTEYHLLNKLLMSSASIGSCINDKAMPCLKQGEALAKQGQEERLQPEGALA